MPGFSEGRLYSYAGNAGQFLPGISFFYYLAAGK
jgi:hypothetical protein